MSEEADRAKWQEEVYEWAQEGKELLKKRTNDLPHKLIEVLEGEDTLMAAYAAERLQQLHPPEAVEALIHVLQTSTEMCLVAICTIALGKMGDERAVEPLIELLEQAEMRADTEVALHFAYNPPGIRGWFYHLAGGHRWRSEIRATSREAIRSVYILRSMYALGGLQASQAIEPIRKRLADSDLRVQIHAQKVLATLSVT